MTPSTQAMRRAATRTRFPHFAIAVALSVLTAATPAFALSEIKREELPPPTAPTVPPTDGLEKTVPMPDPIEPQNPDEPDQTGPKGPDDGTAPKNPGDVEIDENEPVPEVLYDIEKLPPEVKRLRAMVLAACESGDLEKLRPIIGLGDAQTQLSVSGLEGDPIAYLKSLAGDEGGQEILAILEEVLSAGYVHLDAGTPDELYVWPYFFAVPIDKLTAPQRVELFKIVTASDYEEMKNFGSYIFYRVGITPTGHWAFFVAGE